MLGAWMKSLLRLSNNTSVINEGEIPIDDPLDLQAKAASTISLTQLF